MNALDQIGRRRLANLGFRADIPKDVIADVPFDHL